MKLSRGSLEITEDLSHRLKPVKRIEITSPFWRSVHNFILPFVTSRSSNQFVADFQQGCGLRPDGSCGNLFLKYYFRLASTAGEEIFSLMPMLLWLCIEVGLPFSTNFGVMLTLGQLTKDLLCLPRPAATWKGGSRPIVKLEKHFETEYGFPSTHTMSGLLPLSVLLGLVRFGYSINDNWWVVSFIYVVSVACSRLYMGVHSLVDIVGGLLLGAGFIIALHTWGDQFDRIVYKSQIGIVVIFISLVLYLTVYPKTRPWSASYGTSAQLYGTWLGVSTSFWISFVWYPDVGAILESVSMLRFRDESYSLIGKRMLVGYVIVIVVKVLVKLVATALFLFLRRRKLIPVNAEEEVDVYGHKVPDHKTYWVEVPVRLLNYSLLAVATIIGTPLAWKWFDLLPQ